MRIQRFRNLHDGKRAFIVCNGPSLNTIDLSLLKNEITFGCNRIYLHKLFYPKYYTAEDWLDVTKYSHLINSYKGPDYKFIAFKVGSKFVKGKDVVYIDFKRWKRGKDTYKEFNFVKKDKSEFYWGATVTYLMLQLAFYMGCNPIYIIGADHNWGKFNNKPGSGVGDGKDKYHFTEEYLEEGLVWDYPIVDVMDKAYQYAKTELEKNNITVYNATPNSNLEVFDKIKYEEIFNE